MMEATGVRSLLFVPGDDDAKMRKALASEADAVILDLEDAVALERKAFARDAVRAVLDGGDRRDKPVFVRVNALDSGLAVADLAGVAGGRPWGVVLPKCRDNDDLARIGCYLEALEAREGILDHEIRLLAICTETAEATLGFGQARKPAPRLWGAMWGGEDLAAAIGARENRERGGDYTFPFRYARAQCLLSAAAYQAVAVDAVYTDFRDMAGLEHETAEGARDGFTAKAAIHPAQVEVINRVFTPTADQLAWARTVVDLLADRGVARLDGRMIDIAHKRQAERLLRRARAVAPT